MTCEPIAPAAPPSPAAIDEHPHEDAVQPSARLPRDCSPAGERTGARARLTPQTKVARSLVSGVRAQTDNPVPDELTQQRSIRPSAAVDPTTAPLLLVERERTRARVLMYHAFGWSSERRPAVTPDSFKVQLEWLRDHPVAVVRVSQLVEFLTGHRRLPAQVAVITIDDAEASAYSVAFPLLKRFGFPFALAAPTETVEHHIRHGAFSWQQLREMLSSGLCEVISHGHTHRNLVMLRDPQAARELSVPRRLFEQHAGVVPETLAFPLGGYSSHVQDLARQTGYRAAFTAQGGPVTDRTPLFAIPRYAVDRDTSIFTFAHFFRHNG